MDDIPPPPYSAQDPHAPSPTLPFYPNQDITAFNAFVGTSPLISGLPVEQSSGQSSVPACYTAPSRSLVSPNLAAPGPSTTSQARANAISAEELARAGFVSGGPYFELRTPVRPRPASVLYHHISIGADALSRDFSFPKPVEKWSSRDIDDQDWMTFLNHLFLQHVEGSDRPAVGLGAEHELVAIAFPGDSKYRQEESQSLLRNQSGPSTGRQHLGIERARRARIEAVVAQWNEGFFGPRGLEILVDINDSTSPFPPQTIPRRISGNILQKRPPSELDEGFLHKAISDGKKSRVKLLLDKGGEDLEALNKKGETVLFRAVSRGNKDIVQLLLDNGANPLARPDGSDSLLHVAVSNDKKSILNILLGRCRAGIEETNFKGETPLYVACRKRYTSCIEVLLEKGANPNARPAGQENMLNISVSGDNKSIAKLFLKAGVDVEEKNKSGETPLYRAISRGHTSIVKLLLDNGASAASRTLKGEAPLSAAVSRGDKSSVLLLLAQKDVDVEVEDDKGRTPLYTSIARGDTSISDQLLRKGADPSKSPPGEEKTLALVVNRGNTNLTHLLLERGADFEEKNRSGESPIFQAVSRGDTTIVSLLLGKGADPNVRNLAGESALQRAVNRSSASIVSLLLGKGADPNLKIVTGENPLWQAVYRTNTSIVSILLAHGANVETRNPSGESVLQRAIYSGDTSIISVLLANGADPSSKCASGESVLEYAAKRGSKTNLRLLQNYAPPVPPEK